MENISLQRRAFYKVLLLFIVVFIFVAFVSILAIDEATRNDAKTNLLVRKQVVEQVFNDYLTRAEYEMGYISQDLVLGDYQPGNELEVLFSHHEVLFFGGLDFFYINWSNHKDATDPRARVYTQESLTSLLPLGRINHWVKVAAEDGAIFLMYKKKLVSKDRILLGYLYGFVSLNNNLTLSSELLDGAKADLVQLYDSHTGSLLLKESKVDFDPSDSVVSVVSDIVVPVDGSQFRMSIAKRVPISDDLISAWLRVLLFAFLVLAGLYALVMLLIKRLIFAPLSMLAKHLEHDQVFSELQPIQIKSTQYRTYLNAKENRFQLLLESTHSAIIFCNEMAEVTEINREAKRLFPRHENTRTVFDFMPIACHQAIQEALKGGVGVSFELTISHINEIYHWQVYSFINENAFRSIVLIGRDTTQEKRLSWQLEQLKPSSLDVNQRLEMDVLLNEMSQLSQLPLYSPKGYVQGWIGLLLAILADLKGEDGKSEQKSIGTTLNRESDYIIHALGLGVDAICIDCPVTVGAVVISTDVNLRSLLRLLLMVVVANDMPEKRLTVRFEEGELEMTVSNDMVARPFFQWVSSMVLKSLGGQLYKLRSKAMRIRVPFDVYSVEEEALPDHLVVAWIANDYPDSDTIQNSLERLGAHVELYFSSDNFFMQAGSVVQFDAILIGCAQDIDAQRTITKDLQVQHNRDELPIIWLNTKVEEASQFDVFTVFGCVFDYSLNQALLKAIQREPIMPTHLGVQGQAWIIIGGSRVAKAIWYAELEQRSVASQWLADLSEYEAILPYYPDAVIILLEPQVNEVLYRIQNLYPQAHFFALQEWSERPDNVSLFEMNTPYSGEQISALKEFIQCQTIR